MVVTEAVRPSTADSKIALDPTDPTHALYLTKRKLAADLSCREELKQIESTTASLEIAVRREADLRLSLAQAKRELDDAESMAEINAPGGNNESERKKNKLAAIKDDPACKQAASVVANRERELSTASVDVDSIKRQLKTMEITVEYRIAVMRLLAG